MPSLNITLPSFSPDDLDDAAQRRRILGYLYSLHEELRYILMNLDEDNLSQGLKETIESTYQATKTITADVIALQAPAKSVKTLGSQVLIDENRVQIKTPEFYIEINESGQTFLLDESGGVMADLTVTNTLNAPNMAGRYTGAGDVTVGAGGTFASFAELSQAVNNKLLDANVTATLIGDLSEDVELSGMHGRGMLTIDGDGNALSGSLTLRNTGVTVSIFDLTVNGTTYVSDNTMAVMDGVTLNNSSLCLSIFRGGRVSIKDSALLNASTCILMENGAWLSADNLEGSDPGNVCISAQDSAITWRTKRMKGSVSVTACLTSPADISSVSDGSAVDPPIAPTVPTTTRCLCSASGSSYGLHSWDIDNRIRQGYDDGEWRGVMWFDVSELVGKVILSATLTIKRVAGKGGASPIQVTAYTTDAQAKTEGVNPADTEANQMSLGSVANDTELTASIPDDKLQAVIGKLISGGGIMLRTGETSEMPWGYSANYGHIYGYGESNPPVLTVTYKESA